MTYPAGWSVPPGVRRRSDINSGDDMKLLGAPLAPDPPDPSPPATAPGTLLMGAVLDHTAHPRVRQSGGSMGSSRHLLSDGPGDSGPATGRSLLTSRRHLVYDQETHPPTHTYIHSTKHPESCRWKTGWGDLTSVNDGGVRAIWSILWL